MTDLEAKTHRLTEVVFRGKSEMAARMRAVNWDATPLGPVEAWSASLRATVSTLLGTRHAMFLWWGLDLIQFYNDAYRQSLGSDRHPSALGQRGRDCWAEIWSIIGREVEDIMAGGDATWHEDHLVPITRGDFVHDVYWSYSYSPVQDDDGQVGGVLVTVQETTRRVVGEHRARVLQSLADRLQNAPTVADIADAVRSCAMGFAADLPLMLLYLTEPSGETVRLAAAAGAEPGGAAAPETIAADADDPWPVAQALSQGPLPAAGIESTPRSVITSQLWPEPVTQTLTVALTGGRRPPGVVVLGLSPRLPLDDDYRAFTGQMAREISGALDRVRRSTRERQAAADHARAESALLQEVFERSPAFMAVLRGPQHVFELTNPAYERLVSHRPVLGLALHEALPEMVGQGFVELLDRVYQTGIPFVGDELAIQLTMPDGTSEDRYVNFVYQPLRAPQGEVTGIMVSGVDVTPMVRSRLAERVARLDAEQAASDRAAERQQMLTVLEQSPVGILIVEAPSGRHLFTNRKLAEILGAAPEGSTRRDYGAESHRRDSGGRRVSAHAWPIGPTLADGVVVKGQTMFLENADGHRLTLEFTAAPVRDDAGRITAAVAIIRDVTAERLLEAQLRNTERLQAVGKLAGGVAHEVNNQMTVVLGFSTFVLDALGSAHPQSEDVRQVLQAGKRAARVSQQLLAFARQQVTQPRAVDLEEIVVALRTTLEQLLGADKQLEILGSTGGSLTSADPEQVQQVLINLVANSRDATQTGAVIRIGLDRTSVDRELPAPPGDPVPPGEYVRLSVSDDGQGMTAATLSRIFDPFFTTKPVGRGTGLGLPMVFGTLRRHGGYVVARSAAGTGTTVDLYWPVIGSQDAREEDASADAAVESGAGGGLSVLVADDEPIVRALAMRVLTAEGYRVTGAEDGAAALRAAMEAASPPDILVTDVIMPRLNGRELSEAMRARWPTLHVLFMSGHTGTEDMLDRLLPAAAPFLQKPFTPEQLTRAVAMLHTGGARTAVPNS